MVFAGRRVERAVLAAVATTVLAGCGLNPGSAAVVGAERITHGEVDDVALAICSANLASAEISGQATPTIATRATREVALRILVENELTRQFAEHEGVEVSPRAVAEAMQPNESGLATLPEGQREDFREALRGFTESQFVLLEAGRESLGAEAGEEQAIQEGTRLRDAYVRTLDVEVDPRYGSFEDGAFRPGGASLSVPASQEARDGATEQPGQSFVASLPASQQCL